MDDCLGILNTIEATIVGLFLFTVVVYLGYILVMVLWPRRRHR